MGLIIVKYNKSTSRYVLMRRKGISFFPCRDKSLRDAHMLDVHTYIWFVLLTFYEHLAQKCI